MSLGLIVTPGAAMTGDSHSNDESDFLEDEFVVEDLVSDQDELEDLFEEPAPAGTDLKGKEPADARDESPANVNGDDVGEDDLLFADHSEGSASSDDFPKATFAEGAATDWDGSDLDLESVGVPGGSLESEEDAVEPDMAEAEQSFVEELDSLLHCEEEFALDSGEDLELVDMDAGEDDGISELEQSGTFVLDDGDGLWGDSVEAAASEGLELGDEEDSAAADVDEFEVEDLPAFAEVEEQSAEADTDEGDLFTEEETVVSLDLNGAGVAGGDAANEGPADEFEDFQNLQLSDVAPGHDEGAGWEPLPARSMDALSEVDEVQRADEEYDDEDFCEGEEFFDDEELFDEEEGYEDVEGHDIYGEEESTHRTGVLGGPWARGSRTRAVLISMAASLAIIGGAATIVARPAWFGLSVEPEQVPSVSLSRPTIEVAVSEPVRVPVAGVESIPAGTDKQDVIEDLGAPKVADEAATPAVDPLGDAGATADQPDAVAVVDQVAGQQPVLPTAPEVAEAPALPVEVGEAPDPQGLANGAEVPGQSPWPIASGAPASEVVDDVSTLTPFGDGLLIGRAAPTKDVRALDGVMPGSRAFAQLHNGNYFIGKIKQVADESITLRLSSGEVTLANADIAQITRLGSADYEELKKATKGFVRLTNNNRLVGGILGNITDDHVVLEVRSNRVMLPSSLVGEVVSGDGANVVRLGTTKEEEKWVRSLAERELGNVAGSPVENKPQSQPPR
jgi:hypothetical protein